MLTIDGVVKLLDFGISTNFRSETNKILNVDKIEGTLTYISPEQTGRTAYSVSYTSDFYSFGILLYVLFAGKPPFDSVDPLEVIHFHLSRNPLPLGTILPELPKGIDQVIAKLLEKNPDERYHSAIGLRSDLERIKKHYISGETLTNFRPGLNDITEQYKQTQKLYGREKEINKLLGYYKNLHQTKSMLVLVAGYSGVGKSALIKYIKSPIIQNHGTFVSGKFDQFKKDIPYYAFIEAIKEFIKNLLSEPEAKINAWKQRILSVLGENGKLITDVIPQLSRIIGQQPEVPRLQPAEQETRFYMVLLDFIHTFSTAERPLVIFLDDLQWADLPSLNLVKRILENPREVKILIIGCYRNNEVDKGHPLLLTLNQINESKGIVKTIELQPLNQETTNLITADSFGMNSSQAEELGRHVYAKTKGNPFFIHSFLKSLYDKNLIKKDDVNNWVWNQQEIEKLGYTENVIDLMTNSLNDLPIDTEDALKYAAALGNSFNLADLAYITEKSQAQVFDQLKPAIIGGYLRSNDLNYRFLTLYSKNIDDETGQIFSGETVQLTFTHDKVQQAAYNLISESKRASVHLKIGRLLLQIKSEPELNDDIFEVLNHFEISSHLIDNQEEKLKIGKLCLIAGKKAKDSTSYNLAVHFLSMAKNLLGSNSWDENYELCYNTLKELGESEYLNDNPDEAERIFKEIIVHAKTNFDRLKVYSIHTSLYLKIGNSQKSLALGLEAINLYNIRFPKNKKLIEINALFSLAKYLLLFSTKYKTLEDFSHIKETKDEEVIALNKLMIDIASSAYMYDKNLMMLVVLRIIDMYFKKGYSDASGWGFSGLSVVLLSSLKMQTKGFNLWNLTQLLNKTTKSPLIKWRLKYVTLCFGKPWMSPFRENFEELLETIKASVMNGDPVFTGYSVSLYQRYRFIAGINLNELIESSEEHISLIKNTKGGFDFFQCFHQAEKGINGRTLNDSWDDESFNSLEVLKRIEEEGNMTKLGFFHTARLVSLYYFGKHKEVIEENKVVLKYKDNFLGELCEVLHAFYTALSISAIFSELNFRDKKSHLNEFKKNLENIRYWSKGVPSNYEQHCYLLEAEYCVMNNNYEKAIEFYERSIEASIINNFVYVEAISNERAAILSTSKNLKKQTQLYVIDAWNAYHKWGAFIKCQQLEYKYQDLLADILKNDPAAKFFASTTLQSSKTALDLNSVLKASQSIASQVKYEDLLKKLMHITIENAGAERGCFLLYKDDQLCIEAIGISGSENIEILPSVPLHSMNIMPDTLINYCWRSEESVVIDDASEEGQFSSDTYIQQNKVLSVMCLPISIHRKINGLLYLENSLLKGVFDKNRIELLQMLAGQIGISIENSILYENLEEKVMQRTQEIENAMSELRGTQSQLIQSEKMASFGELTAGIAHEIQNPLNFVINFSELSVDLVNELKEEANKPTVNKEIIVDLAHELSQNQDKINNHANRASSIVKGMLEHSRKSNGEKRPTDMNTLCGEYLRLAYHGLRAKDKSFNADFELLADENLPKIDVIPQDMGRVLLNLINNAFWAVNDKKIKLGDTHFKPKVTVTTKTHGNYIEVSVSDNGSGIPQDIKDKIFQPFFSTKPSGQGTGLGLSLSYDIVKAHGGELKVESELGVQTEFSIRLNIE